MIKPVETHLRQQKWAKPHPRRRERKDAEAEGWLRRQIEGLGGSSA